MNWPILSNTESTDKMSAGNVLPKLPCYAAMI